MSATNVVESSREAVQDLPVPALKAIEVSAELQHGGMGSMRTAMKLRGETMEQAIRAGAETSAGHGNKNPTYPRIH